MWRSLVTHAPAYATTLLMVLIALGFTSIFPDNEPIPLQSGRLEPLELPSAQWDLDGDTYNDTRDVWDGDLIVRLNLTDPSPADDAYWVVGTQHDTWRTGRGGALEWLHVVDHDPTGYDPGSQEWVESALRTGTWRQAPSGNFTEFTLNVRDDQSLLEIRVEKWLDREVNQLDAAGTLQIDVLELTWQWSNEVDLNFIGHPAMLGDVAIKIALESELNQSTQQEIAQFYAPRYYFHTGERFTPVRGEILDEYHGFVDGRTDYKTWTKTFNNGRDAYRLLLADFDGDGETTHLDAAIMLDVLQRHEEPTIYARVSQEGEKLVVQYWTIYAYNYNIDASGNEIQQFAHKGDREFIQLTFASPAAALNGSMPIAVSYSQHYDGVRIDNPVRGQYPFPLDHRPHVYVALGAHASYPAPGDDSLLRGGLDFGADRFDGQGTFWNQTNVELLASQDWHQGYLWGPITRHSRDLGIGLRPLQQHSFTYPFQDPLHWQESLKVMAQESIAMIYGAEP